MLIDDVYCVKNSTSEKQYLTLDGLEPFALTPAYNIELRMLWN